MTSAVLLVPAAFSLAVFSAQRSLQPLFGASAVELYTLHAVVAGSALGVIVPAAPMADSILISAILLMISPQLTYHLAVYTFGLSSPNTGPIIHHIAVTAPLAFLASSIVQRFNGGIISKVLYFGIYMFGMLSGIYLWGFNPIVFSANDTHILAMLGAATLAVWSFLTPPTTKVATAKKGKAGSKITPAARIKLLVRDRKKVLTLALPIAAISILVPPTLNRPLTRPYTHPGQAAHILSSERSVTGTVIVGEMRAPLAGNQAAQQAYRYLRVDNNLLGAVWLGERAMTIDWGETTTKDAAGTPLGDSVYPMHALQEPAFLAELTGDRIPRKALILGLGAGVAARTFQQHGINTTIVEKDPAVYKAARRYFGLANPGPDGIIIEDRHKWVKEHAVIRYAETIKYDIVVQEFPFSDRLPVKLYSYEFWRSLRMHVQPDGVLVVNHSGRPDSDSVRRILKSLQKLQFNCRVFYDRANPKGTPESLLSEHLNMSFFCSRRAEGMKLRTIFDVDLMNSPVRRERFRSLEKREIELSLILGPEPEVAEEVEEEVGTTKKKQRKDDGLLYVKRNPLWDRQDEYALWHWQNMKQVLPAFLWTLF